MIVISIFIYLHLKKWVMYVLRMMLLSSAPLYSLYYLRYPTFFLKVLPVAANGMLRPSAGVSVRRVSSREEI